MALSTYFEERFLRVKRALPSATESMVSAFMVQHDVGLVTVAIWAEQGAVIVDGDALSKVNPPTSQDRESVRVALSALSVERRAIINNAGDTVDATRWDYS